MTNRNGAAPKVSVQSVGKVTKCRNCGEPIVFITAVSRCKRKEKQENEKATNTSADHVRGIR